MSRSIFGWSLPPGVTQRMIDEQAGADRFYCEKCDKELTTDEEVRMGVCEECMTKEED